MSDLGAALDGVKKSKRPSRTRSWRMKTPEERAEIKRQRQLMQSENPPTPLVVSLVADNGGGNMDETAETTTEASFSVQVNVEGCKPKDLEITLRDRTIVIEGNRTTEDHLGMAGVYFFRSIRLPLEIDPKTVTATITHEGGLTIEACRSKDKDQCDVPLIVPIVVVQ